MFWSGWKTPVNPSRGKLRGEAPRLAILGAGPVGVEACLIALRHGYRVKVYDRGDIAESLRQWGHIRLFSPFGLNVTERGLALIRKEHPGHPLPAASELITAAEFRDAYFTPLSLCTGISDALILKTEVLGMAKAGLNPGDPADDPRRRQAPFILLVRDDKKQERYEEADIVLDCTGFHAQHRHAGPGGLPAIGERPAESQIAYGWEDILGVRKAHYAGKNVLVIGSGYSAAASVCQLMTLAEENPATWTIWLSRAKRGTPLPRIPNDPFKERDRLAARANNFACRCDGNLEYHSQVQVEEIQSLGPDKGFRLKVRLAGEEKIFEGDRLIANVGHRPDAQLARELLGPAEPNFYMAGSKAAQNSRSFLLKDGYEQLETIFAMIGESSGWLPGLSARAAA